MPQIVVLWLKAIFKDLRAGHSGHNDVMFTFNNNVVFFMISVV